MPRRHLFVIAVLLGAVFVAGMLAVSRTVILGQPAKAATSSDPAIAFRLKKLDRFEASLERRAARLKSTSSSAPITVYRRAPQVQVANGPSHDDDASEHGDEAWADD
jgi:hypothetical protein